MFRRAAAPILHHLYSISTLCAFWSPYSSFCKSLVVIGVVSYFGGVWTFHQILPQDFARAEEVRVHLSKSSFFSFFRDYGWLGHHSYKRNGRRVRGRILQVCHQNYSCFWQFPFPMPLSCSCQVT